MNEDEEFEALEQRLNYKPKEQAMNREDIICMAREAQSVYATETWTFALSANQLERFAALVAAAEREACAKVCEDDFGNGALNLAAAIRARSKQ